jgi:O-antigen/teichoic acid export membrane protein
MAAPSLNLLKRRLDFRRVQMAQVGAYAAGYLAFGLPLAWVLGDVRALVVAWLVQSLVALGGLYRAVRHPLRPLWNTPDRPALLSTGLTVMVTNLLNWLLQNVDRTVVAQRYAARSVGSYSAAFNLVYTPTATLLGVLQPVLQAAASRLPSSSDGAASLARVYRAVLLGVAVGLAPFYAATAVLAEPIIALLYGPAWQEAAPLLRPFALAMPAFLIWGLSTPVLWAAGQARQEFRSQLPVLLLWLLACAAAAHGPITGVAWSVAALFWVRALMMVGQVVRVLALPWRALGAALGPGLVGCVSVGLAALALQAAARAWGLSGSVLALPTFLLGWAGGLLPVLAWMTIPRDLQPMLRPVCARLPVWLQRVGLLRDEEVRG